MKIKLFNNAYYTPNIVPQESGSMGFIALVCVLAFSEMFGCSGLANALNYHTIVAVLSVCAFLFLKKPTSLISGASKTFCLVSCSLMAFLAFINYQSEKHQIINLVSTFGIILFVQRFSLFKWEKYDMKKLGLALSVFGLVETYLLLPGNLFSGWNSNSSILAIPVVLMGISCLIVSGKPRLWQIALIFFAALLLLSKLANRSSLIAMFLYAGVCLYPICIMKRKWFRILYGTIILINVATPFFSSWFESLALFNELIDATADVTESGKIGISAFNGREAVWEWSVDNIHSHPLFGLYGARQVYPHNFSLDLLNQFGWLGWITFTLMLVVVLEKSFKEGSKYNVFLLALLCVILLNTFENCFTCCNTLSFFSYVLIAVALRFNKDIACV